MDTNQLPKVDHPKFEGYIETPGHVIACFRFGYVERPPAEVLAAYERIRKAVSDLAVEEALLRQWQGRIHVSEPLSRDVNPDIIDDDYTGCVQAAKRALPDLVHDGDWFCQKWGLIGISVRFRTDAAT